MGEERASLQRIDAAFRAVLALDPRPYDLGADHAAGTWTLSYDGPALSPEHEGQVRDYIAFLHSSKPPAAPTPTIRSPVMTITHTRIDQPEQRHTGRQRRRDRPRP